MIPLDELPSSAVDDAEELALLAKEAEEFLRAHTWCRAIRHGYFDRGWAGILAVFYFEIEPRRGADDSVWVIAGDVPPAYLDIRSCPSGAAAIEGYVGALQEWIARVRAGESVKDIIPVYYRGAPFFREVDASEEYVDLLQRRLRFIEEKILPDFADELQE